MGASRRILVVFESGPRGAAALADGVALARAERPADAAARPDLVVLALAPSQPVVRCGPCDDALDRAVIEAAEGELVQAREVLAPEASLSVAYETLAHADVHSLAAYVAARGFDAVVVPRRRFLAGGHVRVRTLMKLVAARVVVAGSGGGTPPVESRSAGAPAGVTR